MNRRTAFSLAFLLLAVLAATAAGVWIGTSLASRRPVDQSLLDRVDSELLTISSVSDARRTAGLLRRATADPPSAEYAASVAKRCLRLMDSPEVARQAHLILTEVLSAYPGNPRLRLIAAYAESRLQRPLRTLAHLGVAGTSELSTALALWAAAAITQSGRLVGSPLLLSAKARSRALIQAWEITVRPSVAAAAAALLLQSGKYHRATSLITRSELSQTGTWFPVIGYAVAGMVDQSLAAIEAYRRRHGSDLRADLVEAQLRVERGEMAAARELYRAVIEEAATRSEPADPVALLSYAWTLAAERDPLLTAASLRILDDAAETGSLDRAAVAAAAYELAGGRVTSGTAARLPSFSPLPELEPWELVWLAKTTPMFDQRGYVPALWELALRAPEQSFDYIAWYFLRSAELEELRRLLDRSPRTPTTTFYEAMLLAQREEWNAAAVRFEESLVGRAVWQSAYNAALAWINAGDRARALELLTTATETYVEPKPVAALSLHPHVRIAVATARVLASLDRFDDAQAVLNRTIAEHPETPVLLREAANLETAE